MDRIKCVLVAVWVAGCGGSGPGLHVDAGPGGDDANPDGPGVGNPDAPNDASSDGPGVGNPDAPNDASLAATNDRCANATPISLSTMHVSLSATTTDANADLAAPCGTSGQPDVFFTFTLTRRELVYADTFGASAGTTLYFATSCTTARTGSTTTNDAVCSTGACGTGQSQVVALLDPGTHYLVLAGQGAATIHFQHAEVGTGDVAYLPQGSSTATGTTTSTGLLYACDGGGGEDAYWWQSCPLDAGGTFTGSTCSGTTFDTILSLQLPGTDATMCDDDSCSVQSFVSANIPAGAGLHVISVDGFSQAKFGNYTLSTSRP
jgi:hypothetical protein